MMRLISLELIAVVLIWSPAFAQSDDVIRTTAPAVGFRYGVVPILTRSGCNAGTCHGTPSGKNGFHLSLRGYNPDQDLETLTRDGGGRRLNIVQPDQSLLLRKATAQIPHQGGQRFSIQSLEYERLRDWIQRGALDDPSDMKQLKRISLNPAYSVLGPDHETHPLRVIASFADGTQEDVTKRCRFSVSDDAVAVPTDRDVLQKVKRGEVTVSAEFAGRFASATVVFQDDLPGFTLGTRSHKNKVDSMVFEKLALLQLEPSELCDDETFVRRVYLDVVGHLPSQEQVLGFLKDDSNEKRARLIDTLLGQPEFATWWAMKWTDRLGCNQRFVGKWGAIKYHRWISNAMAVNMPEDEFVRTLLTASGPNYSNPPSGFWRRLRKGGIGSVVDPLLAAEEISQLFLGVRIQCARCHNHPGERWTQDDYYGLAAFFPRLKFKDGPYVNHSYDKENTVYAVRKGDVTHPLKGMVMAPKFLGAEAPEIRAGVDRRFVFANWVTDPQNPFFAHMSVNRIWFHLMGRGIVDPVDDFRASNPPSHPSLLNWLAKQFVDSGFDRKHIIRTVLNSNTYQLSSDPTETNSQDSRYFSHAMVRLLHGEQLLDAIGHATDVPESFPGFPLGTQAVCLPDGEYKHPFLVAFGRPARALACECERESGTNFAQALELVGGTIVHDKVVHDQGRAARLAGSQKSDQAIIEELFVETLSRMPIQSEVDVLLSSMKRPNLSRRKAVEDILWSLLNHPEFLFQH